MSNNSLPNNTQNSQNNQQNTDTVVLRDIDFGGVNTNATGANFDPDFMSAIQKFEPLFDEPIAKYSTWKIGGPAKILIKTNNSQELEGICLLCDRYGVDFRVVGRISNMLVSDNGFDGVLIVTKDKTIEIQEKASL